MISNFSHHLLNTVKRSLTLANREGLTLVYPRHLWLALEKEKGCLASHILNRTGKRSEVIEVETTIQSNPNIHTMDLSPESNNILLKAGVIAVANKHRYIGTEHLLAALLEEAQNYIELQKIINAEKINIDQIKNQLTAVLKSTSKFQEITKGFFTKNAESEDSLDETKPLALDLFATDLTKKAQDSQIDPVIGRESEIERLITILSRRTKNNPLLLGEAGVGKTAIVEGLAKRIIEGKVPPILLNKKIYALDLGLLVAGSMYRGEFEQRLKQVIEDLTLDPNIILFIDEIHTIVGAGASTNNSMDAANLIKPALAKGELRCIGATTPQEYKQHIETNSALERRFQPIIINEPDAASTLEILRGLKTYYEKFHGVIIPEETLKAAVDLSANYLPNKHFPDKAIDLIDEASALVKVGQPEIPEVKLLSETEQKIKDLKKEKFQAVIKEEFDRAIKLNEELEALNKKLPSLKEACQKILSANQPTITPNEIKKILSQITGLPLSHFTYESERNWSEIITKLEYDIVGQQTAVEALVKNLKRSYAGLKPQNRPIGSFIFLGPSGVGKTLLAEKLAQLLFVEPENFVRLDMSEFSESFSASKLLGAPAGYVGYREGNKLTDAVKLHPHSVVLLDEIEKAHPQIFNLLLPILDTGFITDATGRRIDFSHTIIIMTSNIGSKEIANSKGLGFATDSQQVQQQTQAKIQENLKQKFPPEFLNRLDQTIVFNQLTDENLKEIADHELEKLNQQLQKNHQITLKWSDKVLSWLTQQAKAKEQGARAIKYLINEQITDQIADKVLDQDKTKIIELEIENERIKIKSKKILGKIGKKT